MSIVIFISYADCNAMIIFRLQLCSINTNYLPLSQTHSHLLFSILVPILLQLVTPIGTIHVSSLHVDVVSIRIHEEKNKTINIIRPIQGIQSIYI